MSEGCPRRCLRVFCPGNASGQDFNYPPTDVFSFETQREHAELRGRRLPAVRRGRPRRPMLAGPRCSPIYKAFIVCSCECCCCCGFCCCCCCSCCCCYKRIQPVNCNRTIYAAARRRRRGRRAPPRRRQRTCGQRPRGRHQLAREPRPEGLAGLAPARACTPAVSEKVLTTPTEPMATHAHGSRLQRLPWLSKRGGGSPPCYRQRRHGTGFSLGGLEDELGVASISCAASAGGGPAAHARRRLAPAAHA